MRKLLLIAILLCGFMQAWAYKWNNGNGIIWTFDVCGTEAAKINPNDINTISEDIIIPAKIFYSEKDLSVTNVSSDVFRDCSGLLSVTITECVACVVAFDVCGFPRTTIGRCWHTVPRFLRMPTSGPPQSGGDRRRAVDNH